MKRLIFLTIACLAGLFNALAQESMAEMTFHVCSGHEFTQRPVDLFASELADIENIGQYQQVLTYTCSDETDGASACSENCDGLAQYYEVISEKKTIYYTVTLRLYKDGIPEYILSKIVEVIVYPQPVLHLGTNPFN